MPNKLCWLISVRLIRRNFSEIPSKYKTLYVRNYTLCDSNKITAVLLEANVLWMSCAKFQPLYPLPFVWHWSLKCLNKRNIYNVCIISMFFLINALRLYFSRVYMAHNLCTTVEKLDQMTPKNRVEVTFLSVSICIQLTLADWAPFYLHGLTLISAWMSNHTHYNVWDAITYPFLNFNGATVEVYKWISNCIPHFSGHVIMYPCWD